MSSYRLRWSVAGLLVASLLAWAAVTPSVAQAQEGLLVGKTFQVPVLVEGKVFKARAIVTADKMLVITFPSNGELVDVAYLLTRQTTPPDPTPGPGPKPPPVPVTKPIAVYLIYESQDKATNTPAFAALKQDKAWRSSADAAGMAQHVWDKDDPRLQKLSGVLATANARGLPCVVFAYQDGAGKAEPLPKDAAAMLALVKKYGGQ